MDLQRLRNLGAIANGMRPIVASQAGASRAPGTATIHEGRIERECY